MQDWVPVGCEVSSGVDAAKEDLLKIPVDPSSRPKTEQESLLDTYTYIYIHTELCVCVYIYIYICIYLLIYSFTYL